MTTLMGGKIITVFFEQESAEAEARSAEIKVRQIPIRDYEAGFKCHTDEVALVGFLVGKDREFALTLTPESYEAIIETGKEVNEKGFFSFCRRRIAVNQDRETQTAVAFAQLPAEARNALMAEAVKLNPSSVPSSISQPRRM